MADRAEGVEDVGVAEGGGLDDGEQLAVGEEGEGVVGGELGGGGEEMTKSPLPRKAVESSVVMRASGMLQMKGKKEEAEEARRPQHLVDGGLISFANNGHFDTIFKSYDGCKLVEEEGNRFELENVKFVESDKEGTVDVYLDWAHDGEVDDGLES
ncbi:hypothetical protein RHGRI_029343 [Rhododendron griersonianum]|uniref:Uncharacterized protein n=1 Tax=Rhododendron griersonianum TaxID=479676 RepID=A0AAV6IJ18_9ERIC|nr:hypothetical protein RHGRI_029343 [Rhododendron griersonianum]